MGVLNVMKLIVVVAGLLVAATPVSAMTGQQFLLLADDDSLEGAGHMAVAVKPLVHQFVEEGYHNVPDWGELQYLMHKLILAKGYRDKDFVEIAREAAIADGMAK
jgi:hypothetical protein